MVFARGSLNCLAHIQDEWPRTGILRIEIVHNAPSNYSIIDSYNKEYHDESFFDDESTFTTLPDADESPKNETENNSVNEPLPDPDNVPDMEEYWHSASSKDVFAGKLQNETVPVRKPDTVVRRGLLFGQTISEFEMLAKVGKNSVCVSFVVTTVA